MTETWERLCNDLVQALLRNLEKDLSDTRNLSDIRIRFIPRQALLDIISEQRVERLVERLPIQPEEEESPLRDMVGYISPPTGGCRCQKEGCTGARMILSILLFIGRADLIVTLLPNRSICDQSLPFGTIIADETTYATREDQFQSREPEKHACTSLFDRLSADEKDLFSYWQWHVISPFLSTLNPDETGHEEPDEACLPWQEIEHVRAPRLGELAYVQRIKVFPGSHNIVSNTPMDYL